MSDQAPTNDGKFELVTQVSAAKEKAIQRELEGIRLAINGHKRAGAVFFAQAAIAAQHMENLVELLPNGEYESTLAREFPDVSESTRYLWRQFRRQLVESVKTKTPTVGVLTTAGKLKLGKKTEAVLLKLIPELMDGKTFVQFARGIKLLPEPKPDGGYRVDQKLFAEWIKQHPDLKGKSYEELEAKWQREYRSYQARASGPSEGELLEADREWWRDTANEILRRVEEKSYAQCFGPEHAEDFSQVVAALYDAHQGVAGYQSKLKRKN